MENVSNWHKQKRSRCTSRKIFIRLRNEQKKKTDFWLIRLKQAQSDDSRNYFELIGSDHWLWWKKIWLRKTNIIFFNNLMCIKIQQIIIECTNIFRDRLIKNNENWIHFSRIVGHCLHFNIDLRTEFMCIFSIDSRNCNGTGWYCKQFVYYFRMHFYRNKS